MGKKIKAVDARGYTVTCSGEYWDTHVLVHHPDLAGHEEDAKRAIETKSYIFSSVSRPDRHIYYGPMRGRRSEIKVVVAFNRQNLGIIVSVSAVSRRPGGEKIVWT